MAKYQEVELTPEELAAYRARTRGPGPTMQETQAAPPTKTTAQPSEPPGYLENLLAQFGAGATKQGMDELTGALVIGATGGGQDTYRKARGLERSRQAAGKQGRETSSFLANMGGDIASDYLLSKVGVNPMNPAVQAALGGVSGLLGSEAELTGDNRNADETARAALDTTVGAGLGVVLPKVGGAAVRAAGPLLKRASGALQRAAIGAGRRVIGGDSDIAAATREALPDEAVLRALKDRLIRPFSTTADTYKRIDEAAETLGADYGSILARLEELGVTGPRAVALAAQFMKRANEEAASSVPGSTAPRILARTARALGQQGQTTSNLPLGVAENLKRSAQKMGRHERITNSPGETAYQEIGSVLKKGIEDEIEMAGRAAGQGSEIADLAAQFKPTKERLSELLAARNVGERGASKALQRSSMGLKDYLVGVAMGDPGLAAATALASSSMRNRAPSALASGLYATSQGALATPAAEAAMAASRNPEVLLMLADWIAQDSELDGNRLKRKRERGE